MLNATRWLRAFALGLFVAAMAVPANASVNDFRGRKRLLFVFAPSDQHPRLIRQRSIINGTRTALQDRDIIVLYVTGTSVKSDFGPPPGENASALRTYFRTSEGMFRTILLAKDGNIRLDSSTPLTASDLLSAIDRTPTRSEQTRQRSEERSVR